MGLIGQLERFNLDISYPFHQVLITITDRPSSRTGLLIKLSVVYRLPNSKLSIVTLCNPTLIII